MPIRVTVQRERTSVDLLLWRAYGRRGQTSAMLAETFALNPGLAGMGPFLPLLTPVLLPDLPAPSAPARRPAVSLFD